MENLEPLVQCPLDKSHRIKKSRLQYHLVRCEKNFDLSDKTKCPYNSTHIVYKTDYLAHLRDCPSSGIVLNEVYDDGSEPYIPVVSMEAIQATPVPEGIENWDDEPDVPTYNPMEATENRMIIRQPVGLSKSQRKAFRARERERFKKLAEEQPEERRVTAKAPAATPPPDPAPSTAPMFNRMDRPVPLRERKTMSMAQAMNGVTDLEDLTLSQLSLSDSSTYNEQTKSRGKYSSSPSPSSSSSTTSSSTSLSTSISSSIKKGSPKFVKPVDVSAALKLISSKNNENEPRPAGESMKAAGPRIEPQKIEKIEKIEKIDKTEKIEKIEKTEKIDEKEKQDIEEIEKRIQELEQMEKRIKEEKEKLEQIKNREIALKSQKPSIGSRCAANFSNLRSPGGQTSDSNPNVFKFGIGRGSLQNLSLMGINGANKPFMNFNSFAKKNENIIENNGDINNSNIDNANGMKIGISSESKKNLENKENEERENLETEDLDLGDFDDVQLDDEDIMIIMENSKAK